MALTLVVATARAGLAATPCALPDAYPIALEQRSAVLGTGPGVVAPVQSEPLSPLAPGDAVRQANGDRVESCADLERVAAAAFAKGLPLLLAVERGDRLVPLLVQTRAAAAEVASPAGTAPTPATGHGAGVTARADADGVPAVAISAGEVPASARAVAARAATEPGAPPGMPTEQTSARADRDEGSAAGPTPVEKEAVPVRRARVALPPRAEAHPAVVAAAAEALAALRELEVDATMAVPLPVYERRVVDVERAIADVEFGPGEHAAAVRGGVEEILDMYRTANDVMQAKVQYQIDSKQQLRMRALREMPYFSDGDVPRWVAAYPFLEEAIVAPPKATRILIAGESSGRWRPDQATELLWEHARTATARLADWVGPVVGAL